MQMFEFDEPWKRFLETSYYGRGKKLLSIAFEGVCPGDCPVKRINITRSGKQLTLTVTRFRNLPACVGDRNRTSIDCMCVYVCVHSCMCVFVYVCAGMCLLVRQSVCTYTWTCPCVCLVLRLECY